MLEPARPDREQIALDDVARTWIAPVLGPTLAVVLLSLLTLGGVLQVANGDVRAAALAIPRSPALGEMVRSTGLRGANRAFTDGLHRFEASLEEESPILEAALPSAQWFTTALLGAGNTRTVIGREGWLYYRPDIDTLTGPPLLEPRAPSLGAAKPGDPREDLTAFAALARPGLSLFVVLAPAKPAIHPEQLAPGARAPLANPSQAQIGEWLAAQGIPFLDPSMALVERIADTGLPQYLATDTHWTFAAMDFVAQTTAATLRPLLSTASPGAFRRDSVAIAGRGDLVGMLRLRASDELYPAEPTTIQRVTDAAGNPWAADGEAEVLLLGDSFSLIYSSADSGWGQAAGFAEQLAFHLQAPVDRIAVNAGGARQTLAAELAAGRDRLAGKRVVVYQLAARHLGGLPTRQ
jgi:SGNH hydrolase-like domain, acetyltransferase AlgX